MPFLAWTTEPNSSRPASLGGNSAIRLPFSQPRSQHCSCLQASLGKVIYSAPHEVSGGGRCCAHHPRLPSDDRWLKAFATSNSCRVDGKRASTRIASSEHVL